MIPKLSLEMYVDSIDIKSEAEVSVNKKNTDNIKKFNRFELLDI